MGLILIIKWVELFRKSYDAALDEGVELERSVWEEIVAQQQVEFAEKWVELALTWTQAEIRVQTLWVWLVLAGLLQTSLHCP